MEAGRRALSRPDPAEPAVYVVMGVSGSGKSTVGALLARRLGCDFADGDDLHPAANVAKMAAGHSLDDTDRAPWLARVAGWIDAHLAAGRPGVIACSALKRVYRDVLRRDGVEFILLDATRAELLDRLRARAGHFMPAGLLDSQLADLEPPGPDERAVRIAAGPDAADQVERIIALTTPRR